MGSRAEPRPDAKAASHDSPSLRLPLLSSQEPKNRSYFLTKLFHNKPSGAFLHRTGMSLCAPLADSLLVSMKLEVFEVGGC